MEFLFDAIVEFKIGNCGFEYFNYMNFIFYAFMP